MKSCFICPEYPESPHGGIGTFTQELARSLVKAGHEVKVIGVYFYDYPSPDHEVDHGVQVYRLRKGYDKYSWIFARIKQYRMVKEWVRKGEIDLVEAPDSYGWFACWGQLNVTLRMRIHGSVTYLCPLAGK